MLIFPPTSIQTWNRLLKLESRQRYYHKSPGTESLFVVIPDRSGFYCDQEYSWWSQNSCIKAAETGSRYFWSLHDGWRSNWKHQSVRKNIDSDCQVWYKQILDLAEKLGIVEVSTRKTSIQRNRSNIPSCSPIDHYKKFCGYSPSWLFKCKTDFLTKIAPPVTCII